MKVNPHTSVIDVRDMDTLQNTAQVILRHFLVEVPIVEDEEKEDGLKVVLH